MKSGARLIMVIGTQSGAGKSLIALVLCRMLSNLGFRVAPYKAVNMSLNSVVTDTGEEMARAQWTQAVAARVNPAARFNPVLMKPERNGSSQIVIMGRSQGSFPYDRNSGLLENMGKKVVMETLNDLASQNDFVVIEGMGSPSEINLQDHDLANTFIMENFPVECILVGNIYSGGVFASIYGTIALSRASEKIKWLIVNNLAGSPEILGDGVPKLEKLTGRKVLGIVPHFGIKLPGEDSMDYGTSPGGGVWVVRYPHMENYSETDSLFFNGVGFRYVSRSEDLRGCDLLVLPGSKDVSADMEFLRQSGMDQMIYRARSLKIPILGICGGFQMLGNIIEDPEGVESRGIIRGMGLLNVGTEFASKKTTRRVNYSAIPATLNGVSGEGYEIHFGNVNNHGEKPLFVTDHGTEGSIASDGLVLGSNIHGLLDNDRFVSALLGKEVKFSYSLEDEIDRVTRFVTSHADFSPILDPDARNHGPDLPPK